MRPETGLLTQISAAHLVSHLHIMTVSALLPLLPNAMGVSFLDLGMALGLFNIVSALCQTPLGYAVDRYGARNLLLAGLALGSASFALVAIVPSYPVLLITMVFAGVANGVYHPANYALLSKGMDNARMGRAFSIHTFAGFLGGALAPPIMMGMALMFDVRSAFAAAAFIGAVVFLAISIRRYGLWPPQEASPQVTIQRRPQGLTPARCAILVLTLLFMMLSLSTGAIERFSVAALVEGFGVPLSLANIALTAFLFASAFGVLAGGILADRTSRHGFVAAGALGGAALLVASITMVQLSGVLLVAVLGAAGFLTGIVAPSRDMLVRAAAPMGQEGKTFGIVSTGFNFGGVFGPILFGVLLDNGLPSGVLWASAGFMIVTTIIVVAQEKKGTKARTKSAI